MGCTTSTADYDVRATFYEANVSSSVGAAVCHPSVQPCHSTNRIGHQCMPFVVVMATMSEDQVSSVKTQAHSRFSAQSPEVAGI
jgi:hypothetical protein